MVIHPRASPQFLSNRVYRLLYRGINNNIIESGMNIDDSDYLASVMEEDKTMSIFFHLHMKEHTWQLQNLLAELNRRHLFQRTQQDTQIGPWLNSIIQFSNMSTI